jgi:hypothetical protein
MGMGTTWGDGPPARRRVPVDVSAADPGPAAAAGPTRLERALADLRWSLDQWRRGEAPDLSIIDATTAYLAALDAEGADPP